MRAAAALLTLALCGAAVADPRPDASLAAAAYALGDVRYYDAAVLAYAAQRRAVRPVDAELIVAIAWAESRFQPKVRTGRACGVMQVVQSSVVCDAMIESVDTAVLLGVAEIIDELLHDARVHGDLRLALLARACGNAAFGGECAKDGWVRWVMYTAEKLRRRTR